MSNTNNTAAITVETVVNAPIEKVWSKWTTPEDIMQWNNASPDWHTPSATNDLEVGGKFSYTMAAKDGSMSFDFWGEYVDVQENKRIEYNMGDGRNAHITFTQENNGVKITEVFEPESTNSIELQQGGWQAILDSFKNYVEAN
jgi:uncharacterized protein YndB with AHSA1/START domain